MTVEEVIKDLLKVQDKTRELIAIVVATVPTNGELVVSNVDLGLENEDCYPGIFYITVGEPQ